MRHTCMDRCVTMIISCIASSIMYIWCSYTNYNKHVMLTMATHGQDPFQTGARLQIQIYKVSTRQNEHAIERAEMSERE